MDLFFAQINIARAKYLLDDPRMSDFINNIESVNSMAEKSPGFIWRWVEEPDSGVDEIFGDPALVVNMSVWKSREALFDFTYKGAHARIFKRRKEWFSKLDSFHMACWHSSIPRITLKEAKKRLDHLNRSGETPYAFTLKTHFSKQDALAYGSANSSAS